MPKYICGATSDIGVGREQQEDFVQFCELDEETLLCIVADGTGSMPQRPQPASIVAMDIIENIKDSFGKKPDLLIKYPKFFLEKAMNDANRILGAFQMGNEELFSGYSASVTCCLFLPDRKIAIGHSGNTRLYIIRNGKVNLITHDHTQAYELLQEGKIDSETYYVHDGRLKLTSGIGKIINPRIDTISGKLQEQDLVLMTTDLFDEATEANQDTYNNLNTDLTQKTQKELLKIVDTDSSVLFAGSDKQAAKNQLKQIKQATNASGKITRKVNAITDAASDSWNRLKNSVTAKSEDEIKDALQSNVEANKKDKWGFRGKKSITGFIN